MSWLKKLLSDIVATGHNKHEIADKEKTPAVDISLLSPELKANFEQTANRLISSLRPRLLLINMCGPWHSRRTGECWIAIGGGYTRYGQSHESAPRWPLLQGYLEQHEGLRVALDRLNARGIKGHYGASGEHNLHAFYYIVSSGENEVSAIRELAKDDFGILEQDKRAQWDSIFDLYLKQNWTADKEEREEWSRKFPQVKWDVESGPSSQVPETNL